MLAKHRLGYMPDYDMSMIISTKLGVLEMVPPDSVVACEELLLLIYIPEVQTHHLPPILTYLDMTGVGWNLPQVWPFRSF